MNSYFVGFAATPTQRGQTIAVVSKLFLTKLSVSDLVITLLITVESLPSLSSKVLWFQHSLANLSETNNELNKLTFHQINHYQTEVVGM